MKRNSPLTNCTMIHEPGIISRIIFSINIQSNLLIRCTRLIKMIISSILCATRSKIKVIICIKVIIIQLWKIS
jgi:hypothetical protein